MLFPGPLGFSPAWHRVIGFFLVELLSLGPIAAATSASGIDSLARERALTAEAFVSQKLWVWQKRLKLQDWNINVKVVRGWELKPRTLGNIHWDTEARKATLRVLDLVDYKLGYPEVLKDLEFTIVHELVHLQLSSLPRSEASRSAEERAVNVLTEALLTLDRR